MRVIGMDLSLTSTGLAQADNGRLTRVENIKSKGKKGDTYHDHWGRIMRLAFEVELFITRDEPVDLVVIEAPSYGSKFGSAHERAGLWWEVYDLVAKRGIPIATVAPTTRAKYITGRGRADKATVLAHAIHAYVGNHTPRIVNDDEADAVGLCGMGARFLGEPIELHPLDQANLDAMETPAWPS